MVTLSIFSFSPEVSGAMTLSEKLSSILSTAVMGFAVVFAVLAIIWLILEIFGKIFAKNKTEEKPSAEAVITEAPTVQTVTVSEPASDEKETVAAIIAAIAAYTGKPQSSFRVVSFKKRK